MSTTENSNILSKVPLVLQVNKFFHKIFSDKLLSLLFIGLFSIFIAGIDYYLPPEVPIDALYAIPIWAGLSSFGFVGGFVVATVSVILFYLSNFLLLQNETSGHFWLAICLTYLLLIGFNFIAFKYLQSQKKLVEAHEQLQTRLIELAELHKQTEDLHSQNLKLAVIEERNRIAREIHDVLAQGFTAIILQVEVAQVRNDLSEEIKERFSQIDRLARYNLKEARRSVSNLRPLALESGSIVQALGQKVNEYNSENNINATFNTSGQPVKLSTEVETALIRISQEALSNVAKHSRATEVQVALDYDEEEVCLTIQDNGHGFIVATQKTQETTGFGLSTMQERARLVGGLTTIQSQPGDGCRVRVIVPYERKTDETLIAQERAR